MLVAVIGWFGTVLYILNYAYMSLYPGWKRHVYFSANGIAAIALVFSSAVLLSWQAVGINSFWAAISLWLLVGRSFDFVRFNHWVVDAGIAIMWLLAIIYIFFDWHISIAWLGWTSTWTFSFAYLLFAAQKMGLKRYLLCNAYSAIILLPQLYLDNNWPVFGMEVAWFCISLAGLTKLDEQKFRDPV